jgi:ArsR family transcriptional regulator, arsenate/arsenite/antimonite-responsive transcriptional repressor
VIRGFFYSIWTLAHELLQFHYFYNSRNIVDASCGSCQLVTMNTADAATRLEALGNPTRLAIYRLLVRAGDTGVPVGRVQQQLVLAASTLSHHLKALLIVGLVTQERSGTVLICRANYPMMRGIIDFLADECCAGSSCVSAELQAG